METENGWDQALYNECIFFPSRPGYKVSAAQQVHHPPCFCVQTSAGRHAVHICCTCGPAIEPTLPLPGAHLPAAASPPLLYEQCASKQRSWCCPQDPSVTRRVLDYMLFMNSKVGCVLAHVDCLVSMHIATP